MRLYHYSNVDIKDKIDPKCFGANSYTSNDRKACSVDRSFFYLKPDVIPEWRFRACQFRYTVDVALAKLYDITQDPKNLLEQYTTGELLYTIKQLGYKGAIYNVGFDLVIYFYNIKPIEKIERRTVQV